MEKDYELGKRITWMRKNRGLEQKEAAKAIGISIGSLQIYEYGARPSLKNLDKIKNFYGCNEIWLLTGEGEPYPGGGLPPAVGIASPLDGFVFIPQMAGSISAGAGLIPDDNVDLRVAFRRDWISRKGKYDQMSLIKVRGDSMEPTLLSGDLVLVDHGRAFVASQGGIYAIAIGSEIMIKRVQTIFPDKLLVISDNKQYAPQEIATENINVNGKVIWYARDLER